MPDLDTLLLDNLALAIGVLAALVLLLLIAFAVQSARLGRAVCGADHRRLDDAWMLGRIGWLGRRHGGSGDTRRHGRRES